MQIKKLINFNECYGLNSVPQNSQAEALIPSTLEYKYIWKYGF